MSVLQRQELEASPLADLHAIASELGLEGFRAFRREELISAILEAQGGEQAGPAPAAAEDRPAVEEHEVAAEEGVVAAEEHEVAAEEHEVAAEEGVVAVEGAAAGVEPDVEPVPDEVPAEEALERPSEADVAGGEPVAAGDTVGPAEEEPEVVEEPLTEEEAATGLLDVLPNGSGFLRVDAAGQSRGDVYVSPAQIRRCELRAGDEVSGPVRPPRRNERHPSLVRVETVNDAPAEPPEERPRFSELTPVFPSERLAAPPALEGVPFGKGSRVAIGGPPGAGATTLLREVASTLSERHPELEVAVVLAGVRPEEVTEWRRAVDVRVSGGGFDRSGESHAQAAELAVERAKRRVERGGDAVVVVDSLEGLPSSAARRVFGAARKAEEGGSLTVIAATGTTWEPQRVATTRVVLDPPSPEEPAPKVSAARSATLRADLLG